MNSRRSFDHLVHASEQLRWHFEPKRPGRLQVDDELEFGRLQHCEVGDLRALEDLTAPNAGLTKPIPITVP